MSVADLVTNSHPPASSPEPTPTIPEVVIEARSGWRMPDLGELWRYRELLLILAWRDVAVRYKQTALGVAWAVVQPLATMAVFSLFLARVGGIADKVENYPLFVLAGLLAWGLFSAAVTSAGNSLVGNQALVTKVYFPRLIIPLSSVGAAVVDLGVGLVLLALAMPLFGAAPGWGLALLPVVVLLLLIASVGVGSLLAALTVKYRDFRYVIPFGVQLWMFATPVIYLPLDAIGPTSQLVMPLNPAYGLVQNFRACVLGGPIDWYSLGVSSAVSLVLFAVGTLYFRRVERSFADVI